MSTLLPEEAYPQLGIMADDLPDQYASLDADMAGDTGLDASDTTRTLICTREVIQSAAATHAQSITERQLLLADVKDDIAESGRELLAEEQRLMNNLLTEPALLEQLVGSFESCPSEVDLLNKLTAIPSAAALLMQEFDPQLDDRGQSEAGEEQ